ncbi:hypothetical protein [Hymenobacter pini]|uniref:hypothetical protein n=1 Tax=Hymenobacter pini TaxID=2880879 RepID=UPI001CF3D02D|nr:hypothetical protein [Hymenobacter pini]MCA8830516.1 hypothetical protein [Hymenobacter pini]
MTTTTKALLTFFVGFLAAIGAVAMAYFYLPASAKTNFATLGTVGDTIGGIAGPLLNLAGMLIVYFSLQEQLNANTTQYEALQLEIGRTSSEIVVKTTEQIIESAGGEIKQRLADIRSIASGISRIDEQVQSHRFLTKSDFAPQANRNLAIQDEKLFEAAMLLSLCYNKVFSDDFPAAYKLFVVRKYHNECIMPLESIMVIKPVETVLEEESVKNFTLMMQMKNQFLSDKANIYEKAWDLSNAASK